MLTDDACRAIREVLDTEALLNTDVFDDGDIRRLVAAINAMPDGPVWVVPREATQAVIDAPSTIVSGYAARLIYERQTAAGAAELTPMEETNCPDCGRQVMADPQPASGFIAACGRRLTRLHECGAERRCTTNKFGETVLPTGAGDLADPDAPD